MDRGRDAPPLHAPSMISQVAGTKLQREGKDEHVILHPLRRFPFALADAVFEPLHDGPAGEESHLLALLLLGLEGDGAA